MFRIEYVIASTIKNRITALEAKLNEMHELGYELVSMTGTTEVLMVFKKMK